MHFVNSLAVRYISRFYTVNTCMGSFLLEQICNLFKYTFEDDNRHIEIKDATCLYLCFVTFIGCLLGWLVSALRETVRKEDNQCFLRHITI